MRLSKKHKFFVWVAIIIAVLVGINNYFEKNVNPIIISVSSARIYNMTVRAVNASVYNVVPTAYVYDNLVTITKDNNGKIASISVNAMQTTQLGNDLVKSTQRELEYISSAGINIPLGTFTGMPILTGRGPLINLRTLPTGSVEAKFNSTFTSAGINQTRHQIKILIQCSLTIIMPTFTQKFVNNVEVLVCESIIVGEVPQVYLNGDANTSINLNP